MPTLNDLSDLGPPISVSAGRLYVLATALSFIYVAAFTTRPFALRLFVVGLIAGDIYLVLTMPDLMGHYPGFDPLIANFIVADFGRVIDLFFLRDESKVLQKKDDADAQKRSNGEKTSPRPTKSKFTRMTAFQAFDYLIMNHRNIRTPWQVRNVPRFSTSNPAYVPSRRQFLVRKFLTVFLAYGLLDLLTCQPQPDPALYASDKDAVFSRLQDVTLEELRFRLLTMLNLWLSTYLLIQWIYALVAFVCVASSVYSPADFPPLVGSLKHVYTVRGVWSFWWHQVLQSPLTSNASALTNLILSHYLHSSVLSRYLKITFTFLLSGISHIVSPLGSGGGSQQFRGTFFFFPSQAVGLAIEDLAIGAYRRITGKQGTGTWAKALGYAWTLCWLTWSCPIWVYPTLRKGGEGMVPYSFLRNGWNLKEMWEY